MFFLQDHANYLCYYISDLYLSQEPDDKLFLGSVLFVINDAEKSPLYVQLYDQLKEEITNNYHVGSKLPSIRKMAAEYKVSKNTVESAYRQFYAEGYTNPR